MFGRFASAGRRRLRLLEKAPRGPVRDYLAHPFPDEKMAVYETTIVCMDFETTGLDTQKDDILSIGYVEMTHCTVQLGTAVHIYLQAQQDIPEASAVIHRITDDMAADEMADGNTIVDVAVDQGGCVETTHPTTHSDPTFLVDDVLHYCVANMPGAVPRTASQALSAALLPFVQTLTRRDWKSARPLARGVNIEAGQITHPALQETFA